MKRVFLVVFSICGLLGLVLMLAGCKGILAGGETRYTLTVTLAEGIAGTPANGSYSYAPGESVDWDYSLLRGYWELTVSLDGVPAAASGTINMDRDHTLDVSAKGILELLALVEFWAYQIQGISEDGAVDALADCHYDMLVLEPTRTDWSSDDKFFDTKAMVERLKKTKASDEKRPKLVIAYIDIGQAEDWRWYWQWSKEWQEGEPHPDDWPDYILTHDPDGWEGNYPVAYWHEDWQDIVIYGKNQDSSPYGDYNSVIDEAIKDGFDGIYLDWVEGFENEAVIKRAKKEGKDARVEMIDFIQEMRDYAAERVANFIIIQQNGSALCDGHAELFEKIDAISQEGIWYEGAATDDWHDPDGYDEPVPAGWRAEYFYYLGKYLAAGLPVFDCEYARKHADDAYEKSFRKGYIPYCTRRSLSALTSTPPPGY